jgi:hypothetical protein
MTPQQRDTVESSIGLGTAWAAVGISSWAEAASAGAAVYTLLLIGHFLWRRAVRPLLERFGFLKRQLKRASDFMTVDAEDTR